MKKYLLLFLCLLFLPLSVNATSSLDDGLVSYFKLDSASGNIVPNSIVSSYNGVLTSTTITNGKINNSYLFDANSDLITFPDVSESSAAFTRQFWINFTNLPNTCTVSNSIIANHESSGYKGWNFRVNNFDGCKLNYIGMNGSTESIQLSWTPDARATASEWVHIVITADLNSSVARMYVNGDVVASDTSIAGFNTDPVSNYTIGKASATFNDMRIDEVAVWNRSLTPSEINLSYNSGNGITYPFSASNQPFVITAVSAWNGSAISSFNATITNSTGTFTYTTSTGNITTPFQQNYNQLVNVSVVSENRFPVYITNLNMSGGFNASLIQNQITLTFQEIGNNISITNGSVNFSGQVRPLSNTYYPDSGAYITTFFNNSKYLNKTHTLNFGSLQNETLNFSGIIRLTNITVRNEQNSALITQNTTVQVQTDTKQYTYTIAGGNGVVWTDEPSVNTRYIVSSNGYDSRTYIYDMFSAPAFEINAYLINNTNVDVQPITLFTRDRTTAAVSGAIISISTFVNGTITVLSEKVSDVSGAANFDLDITKTYYATVSKNGYISQSFSFEITNSVLVSGLSIYLDSDSSDIFNNNQFGIGYVISPTISELNQSANVFMVNFTGLEKLSGYNITLINSSSVLGFDNTLTGNSLSISYNFAGYTNNSVVYLVVEYSIANTTMKVRNIFPYSIGDQEFTGTLKELREWMIPNVALNKRLFLFVFLIIVVGLVLSMVVRGKLHLIITLFSGYFLSYITGIDMWITGIILTIIIGKLILDDNYLGGYE